MDKGTLLEVKASIRSLIMSTNNSMTIQDLEKDFKEFLGYPLPYTSLGYKNTEQLLSALPDVVRISGYGPQALVYFVPSKKTEHMADLIKNQKPATNKRPKRGFQRARPKRIHSERPDKLSVFERLHENDTKQLPTTNYTLINTITKEPIIETTMSSTSTQQKAENENQPKKPDMVRYKNETNTRHSTLETSTQKKIVIHKRFNIKISLSDDSDDDAIATTEPFKELNPTFPTESNRNVVRFGSRYYPCDEIQNSSIDAVPEDAVTELIKNMCVDPIKMYKKPTTRQHSEIPQCQLYEELEKGSVISLYISEIQSPFIFYFHIDKEDHELLKLETQMKDTYSKLAFNDLILMDSCLQPGRYCAAKNDDFWYRAKILAVPTYLNNFSKIKLLFVDYGCINYIPVKHLKILEPTFLSIPVQVACGRLFLLSLTELTRTSEATNFFASLVNDRCLYAYIGNVHKKEPLMIDMILVDTIVQPKRNINEILVEKGFAEKKKSP